MPTLPTLLLVEDDRNIAAALVTALRATYDITRAATGKQALLYIEQPFDYYVLDLNLPDMSGLTICERLRGRGISAPILILSGESRPLIKINLLDAGANDYLTKPFSLGELKARLRDLAVFSASHFKATVHSEQAALSLIAKHMKSTVTALSYTYDARSLHYWNVCLSTSARW